MLYRYFINLFLEQISFQISRILKGIQKCLCLVAANNAESHSPQVCCTTQNFSFWMNQQLELIQCSDKGKSKYNRSKDTSKLEDLEFSYLFLLKHLEVPDELVDRSPKDNHPHHDSLHRRGQTSFGRWTHEERTTPCRRLTRRTGKNLPDRQISNFDPFKYVQMMGNY